MRRAGQSPIPSFSTLVASVLVTLRPRGSVDPLSPVLALVRCLAMACWMGRLQRRLLWLRPLQPSSTSKGCKALLRSFQGSPRVFPWVPVFSLRPVSDLLLPSCLSHYSFYFSSTGVLEVGKRDSCRAVMSKGQLWEEPLFRPLFTP